MEFKVEIGSNGIWLTSEFGLTTCALDFFQFQYGKWFIEITVKQDSEEQEFEDVLIIKIMNDGKSLFINDYEITETTTINNKHYSIYLEKFDLI
jgi:hypothetical protein